jgi:peptide/nickel transport system permease protein
MSGTESSRSVDETLDSPQGGGLNRGGLGQPTKSGQPPEADRVVKGKRSFRVFNMPFGVFLSVAVLLLLILLAIFAPVLTSWNPTQAVLGSRLIPPMWMEGGTSEHILGTDQLGRDLLTRLLYGARISLSVAALVAVFGGGIGAAVGIAAAFHGGKVDAVLMRLVDIVMALPTILVAILLAVALGASFTNIVIVISALLWPKVARQVRGDALVVKEQDYIHYGRAIGVPPMRMMFKHFLPNVTPSLLVITTLEIGAVILTEATLSFLGAGVPPPDPSWGLIVAEGSQLLQNGWWIATFSGLAIMVTVLVFNTIGDWLRDVLDPRLKQR